MMAIDVVLMVPVIVRARTDDPKQAIESAKKRIADLLDPAGLLSSNYKMTALETKGVTK